MGHSGGHTHITLDLQKIPAHRPVIELRSPVQQHLRRYVEENRQTVPLAVAAPDVFRGQALALCGAGPSLATANLNGREYDHIFACNSALPYLVAKGVPVSAGVGIDQTDGLLREWREPPAVPYYIASTCDPALVRHLRAHGHPVYFFHSYVGFSADEFDVYCATWPPTFMVGQGMTVLSRFTGLAFWLGFERVDVYGADCAIAADGTAHADGTMVMDAYRSPLLLEHVIDGRRWVTRPDMLMDAVEWVRRVRASDGKIRLMGDTLPNALMDKEDKYLDLVCRKLAPGERAEAVA